MKNKIFTTTVLMLLLYGLATAQGTWTQMANFGGTGRGGAVGFSIGTKGYIGTGLDGGFASQQDFWEWDGDIASPSYNTWTQKANFGGTARYDAVGFSIGNKGYIGTGYDAIGYTQDFWEWDADTASPAYNTWTQKTNFAGTARDYAVGFSIGTKGYIGTGDDANGGTQDFWEWDQAVNAWAQKTNFGGTARGYAVGFSIGTKGYIGTGDDGTYTQDFWEWDQAVNMWTQRANFCGTGRIVAVGFSIGAKGYIGTGFNGAFNQDFWEFDPSGTTPCIPLFVPIVQQSNNITIYPNPFSSSTTLQTDNLLHNATLTVYNCFGQEVKQLKNIAGHTITLHRDNLPSGLYFLRLTTPLSVGRGVGGEVVATDKLVITD